MQGMGTYAPDKYIRDIRKDSQGNIWSGGFYNLKRINVHTKNIQLYHGLNSITAILERDAKSMWIGSATGLFLLDKESGKYERIKLPVESNYIYSLYQTKKGFAIYRNQWLRIVNLRSSHQTVHSLSYGKLRIDFQQYLYLAFRR